MEVFDKIKWHIDNGMNIVEAQKHLEAIMDYLLMKELLSEEGKDIFVYDGIKEDFSLNSEMLTAKGNSFLAKNYVSYLKDVVKAGIPEAIKILNQKYQLAQIKIPKDKGFLYDSVDAHWPDCKKDGYKNYDEVVYYFKFLLKWLDKANLLNDEAKCYIEIEPFPKNFQLRSWMLKDIVNKAMPPVYDKWLRKIKYGEKNIDMKIIEDAINKEL